MLEGDWPGIVVAPAAFRYRLQWLGRTAGGAATESARARAWEPGEQIARRPLADRLSGRRDNEYQPRSHYQALLPRPRSVAPRKLTACLRNKRCCGCRGRRDAAAAKLCLREIISASVRRSRSIGRCQDIGKETSSWGLGSSAIGTPVERTTRFTMLLHLPRLVGHVRRQAPRNGPALAAMVTRPVTRRDTRTIITLRKKLRRSRVAHGLGTMASERRARS